MRCGIVEDVNWFHCDNLVTTPTFSSIGQLEQVPPDHVISLLEEMTSLCHYCLLDSGQQEVSLGQSLAAVTNNLVNDTATNLLTNLLHVFTPSTGSRVSHSVEFLAKKQD